MMANTRSSVDDRQHSRSEPHDSGNSHPSGLLQLGSAMQQVPPVGGSLRARHEQDPATGSGGTRSLAGIT
jgi:hypothetical protein